VTLSVGRVEQGPAPRADVLLATSTIAAYRFNGRPRDPFNGQHKRVIVFAAADVGPHTLAEHLLDAAERLQTLPPEL
jgi:hypothetical protein